MCCGLHLGLLQLHTPLLGLLCLLHFQHFGVGLFRLGLLGLLCRLSNELLQASFHRLTGFERPDAEHQHFTEQRGHFWRCLDRLTDEPTGCGQELHAGGFLACFVQLNE